VAAGETAYGGVGRLPDQMGTSRDPDRAQRGQWREPASAGGHRPRLTAVALEASLLFVAVVDGASRRRPFPDRRSQSATAQRTPLRGKASCGARHPLSFGGVTSASAPRADATVRLPQRRPSRSPLLAPQACALTRSVSAKSVNTPADACLDPRNSEPPAPGWDPLAETKPGRARAPRTRCSEPVNLVRAEAVAELSSSVAFEVLVQVGPMLRFPLA